MSDLFIMGKTWINLADRKSIEYLTGFAAFLMFALENSATGDGKIMCPCVKCVNTTNLYEKDVILHCITHGFLPNYVRWIFHGECDPYWDVNYFFDHKSVETDRATLKCGGDGDKELHCAKAGCAGDNSKRLLHPEYNAFTQKLGEMADSYVDLISIVLASNRRAGVVLRATMNQLFDEELPVHQYKGDKTWINLEDRKSMEYIIGVCNFVEFAFKKSALNKRILCPCVNCVNIRWLSKKEILGHCIYHGFLPNYVNWVFHAEDFPNDEDIPAFTFKQDFTFHPDYDRVKERLELRGLIFQFLIKVVNKAHPEIIVSHLLDKMEMICSTDVTGPSGSDIYGGGYKRKRGTLNSSESDSDEA